MTNPTLLPGVMPPDQLRRLAPEAAQISILPEQGALGRGGKVTADDADFLLLGM